MDVRVGLWRKLSAKELTLLNYGVGEDSWESLGLQGDPTSPFWRRSVLGVLWKADAKAETPVLWPPHAKSWLIGKDSDAGRVCRQEEKGMTEDEMVVWHHQLDGHEFEWTLGAGDGQGSLECCTLWGHKVSNATERLNWTELEVAVLQWKEHLSWSQRFYLWLPVSLSESLRALEVKGPDAMILVFFILSFKLAFSLFSFCIKRQNELGM